MTEHELLLIIYLSVRIALKLAQIVIRVASNICAIVISIVVNDICIICFSPIMCSVIYGHDGKN